MMADLEDFHKEKTGYAAQRQAAEEALKLFREQQAVKTETEAKPAPQEAAPAGASAGGFVSDVGEGVVEIPSQVIGGVLDAANEVLDMTKEASDWLDENVLDLKLGNFGIGELPDGETENQLQLPTTPEADSTSGALVRGISQFVAGFVGAGKFKPFQNLRALGTGGRIASDALRGAVADFAVFDPHEARLSDLIEQYPALQNPVTEFLQSDPTDSAVMGRFKNALEGVVPGVLVDGVVEGFGRSLAALRSARRAQEALTQVDEVKRMVDTTKAQRQRITELLGDPDKPVFEVKPIDVSPEDLAAGGDKDFFVNWSRIDSPDDIKSILQEMANQGKEGIESAARGKVSWAQTKLDAEQMDAFSVLASRRAGEPLNNAETVAVRELWARSGSKLKELTDAVVSDPSEINKIAFRKMLAVHNTIQEQVLAARRETARALNAWKIPTGSDVAFMGQMDQLRSFLDSGRSTEAIADGLSKLMDAGLVKEADAFVYGSPWAKTKDAVAQLWYFSLLSGPKTHMRNAISNSAVMFNEILERKVASLIGQAKGVQNIPKGEATAQMFGMVQGFRDAFRISHKGQQVLKGIARDPGSAGEALAKNAEEFGTFYRAAASGESGIGIGKVELPPMGAFSPEKLGLDKSSSLGKVMSFVDTVTTAPGRALNSADEVFKSANYRMELNAQAFRRASQEFNAGQITDVQARVDELINNPDEAMKLAAASNAERNTFTSNPDNTAPWKAFKAIGDVPILGKIVLPFRRTPYNIATYTFQRTPLAPLMKQWRDDILAGGAKADIAWSKFLTGNAILLTMADLTMNGDITGEGPSHHNQRATLQRQGWQGSSVRVQTDINPDGSPKYRYFSYRGLEPMATPLGIASNVVDILSNTDWEDDNAEIDEMVIAATMAIANQVTSQQYMSGVSEFFTAMSDPQRYGESWWNRLAGAAIPTGVAEIARTKDPYLRAVYDMTDAIKARTPGISKDLPYKRDAWGRPISRESGLGSFYDAVSPIYSRGEDAEPIDKEVQALELWIGKPPRRTSFDGITISMDRYPKEYDRWSQLQGQEVTETVLGAPIAAGGFVSSGETMVKELNMLVSGKHPNYPREMYDMLSAGPDGGKAHLIRQIVNAYRDAAKEYLLKESPALKAEVDQRKAETQGRFIFQ